MVPDLGHPQSLNRYAYVYNRPLVSVDPERRTPLVVAALPVVILAVAYGSLWAGRQGKTCGRTSDQARRAEDQSRLEPRQS